MKKAIAVFLGICAALGLAAIAVLRWENYSEMFYANVYHPKVKELAGEDMNYEYTLDCFNEDGQHKDLTFKTYYPLEEGSCLKLEVRSTGVYHFDKVSPNEMPEEN